MPRTATAFAEDGPLPPGRRATTRRRLLAAARRELRARGIDVVTIEDIAGAAAVSRATVYLHFAGKAALLQALLDEDWEAQVRLFERLGDVDHRAGDALERWVMRAAEGMRKARDSFGIHWAAIGQNPDMILRHHQHRARLAGFLLASPPDRAVGDDAGTRAIEAELIVAEIEHFATSAAVAWSDRQMALALPLIAGRMRAFIAGERI